MPHYQNLKMNTVILIGRSGSGKTTLTQALKNEPIAYHKTQDVKHGDFLIDTPGEYAESRQFGAALAVYSYESDLVGLVLSATESYSLYSPCITSMANRYVFGVVTKTDHPDARPQLAESWLRLAGCKQVFSVSSKTGNGIEDLQNFIQTFDPKAYFRAEYRKNRAKKG